MAIKTLPHVTPELVNRFLKKTKLNGECLEWTIRPNTDKYGRFYWQGVYYSTHRLGYKIGHDIDPGRLNVCHSCDNTWCVNPDHLFLGTQRDNMDDMVAKGRRGEKLTWDDVRTMRRLRVEQNTSTRVLATRFGISHKFVNAILQNQRWKDAQFRPKGHTDITLNEEDKRHIRKAGCSESFEHLADQFNVSPTLIRRVFYTST